MQQVNDRKHGGTWDRGTRRKSRNRDNQYNLHDGEISRQTTKFFQQVGNENENEKKRERKRKTV